MIDFFISFTHIDKGWAEWIAHTLESVGKKVIFQNWDFQPGSNFVLEMQDAARKANRTIMVLSPEYLNSAFASSEWAATFAQDPTGAQRKLIPVIVRACKPEGLLAQIVHIDIVGLDPAAARKALLDGIQNRRAKPGVAPAFPGSVSAPTAEMQRTSSPSEKPYIPKVRQKLTDVDKRRFMKEAFASVRDYFEEALAVLAAGTQGLEFEFDRVSSNEFTAEIFVQGKSVSACRLQAGANGFSRDGIAYAEGSTLMHSGGANEILSLAEKDAEPALSAMMPGFGMGKLSFDPAHMTPAQASEYLWRRFTARLEY